ncbi:MAG TPA: hypothetical protein VE955_05700 [Candidatus Dormibacteraeota bacterium]|nr:hypothetical protein [Candidatus Dormibacteraeota bacterium]
MTSLKVPRKSPRKRPSSLVNDENQVDTRKMGTGLLTRPCSDPAGSRASRKTRYAGQPRDAELPGA